MATGDSSVEVLNNNQPTAIQLTFKTLFRCVQDLSGFVVKEVRHNFTAPAGDKPRIDISLDIDTRCKRRCSCCRQPGRIHDTLPKRTWHFVPIWNIPVFLHYRPRRVVCPLTSSPTVESMPWNLGKSPYSREYKIFLAQWARRLSWKETAKCFGSSWDAVRRAVEWVVDYGLKHRDLSGVSAIGVDELHHGRGKRSENFVTVIYQIDQGCRRLLWVGRKRTMVALHTGLDELEAGCEGFCSNLKVVCSDMWKAYLRVIRERCGSALNVLDPFHIAKHLNAAVDKVRRGEQSRLRGEARKSAKGGRWLLLKRGTKVRGKSRLKLNAVLASLKQTARAWALKESFRRFWRYKSPYWARDYLRAWTSRAMRSRIEPMKQVARMLRNHEDLLMNYFHAKRQYTSAVVEGMNNKARISLAHSFGHRSYEVFKVALYHTLGELPEPPSSHKFC